jgi:hypothetical protein
MNTNRIQVYRDRNHAGIDPNDGRPWIMYCPCCHAWHSSYYWRGAYLAALIHIAGCPAIYHTAMLTHLKRGATHA